MGGHILGYILCIAEKPSVARDIARVIGADTKPDSKKDGYIIGNGYIVTWAIGHLVGLAEPEEYGYVPQKLMYESEESKSKAYNELPLIPNTFKLTVLEPTKKQFRIVKELMSRPDVDYIIDCGDMGAEGHILQWLIREKAGCKKPVKRFCATSMTDEAINAAMKNLQPISKYENTITGEFCKKKADWIMGMSLSRCASIKHKAGINVGRVQSPTLFFIADRFHKVQNFTVTDYYGLSATFTEGFKAFWNKDTDSLFPVAVRDNENRVLNAVALKDKMQGINPGATATVTEVLTVRKQTNRPQLFDITELQRTANRKYGYTAALTLAAAQSLYETHKVLSYPRTDSRYITSDLQPYMKERIEQIGSIAQYAAVCIDLLKTGLNIDEKIVNDTKITDHHALIVTEKILNFNPSVLGKAPEEQKNGLFPEVLKNILDLVITQMILAFSKPYIFDKTDITVSLNEFKLTASGSKPFSMGFKEVIAKLSVEDPADVEAEDEEQKQIFPSLTKGQVITLSNLSIIPKKTKPPLLHTEATLLTAMENAGTSIENGQILKGKGIGTQATRAEIIKKLFDTGYVEAKKTGKTSYIVPTSKGISIIQVLPSELLSPKITADWENKIAGIAKGDASENEFMAEFTAFINKKVEEIKNSSVTADFGKQREVFGSCPWCGADVWRYSKKDEKGKTVADSYYCSQKCGFSFSTDNNIFVWRTGKKMTESEAKKLIAQSEISTTCVNSQTKNTYRAKFKLLEKNVASKTRFTWEFINNKK